MFTIILTVTRNYHTSFGGISSYCQSGTPPFTSSYKGLPNFIMYDVNETGDVDELRGTVPLQLMSIVCVRDNFHKQRGVDPPTSIFAEYI